MAVALRMQSKVCDAIFLKVRGFRSISSPEKGKHEGFSNALDKIFQKVF